jgi:hypothetical protein
MNLSKKKIQFFQEWFLSTHTLNKTTSYYTMTWGIKIIKRKEISKTSLTSITPYISGRKKCFVIQLDSKQTRLEFQKFFFDAKSVRQIYVEEWIGV